MITCLDRVAFDHDHTGDDLRGGRGTNRYAEDDVDEPTLLADQRSGECLLNLRHVSTNRRANRDGLRADWNPCYSGGS